MTVILQMQDQSTPTFLKEVLGGWLGLTRRESEAFDFKTIPAAKRFVRKHGMEEGWKVVAIEDDEEAADE